MISLLSLTTLTVAAMLGVAPCQPLQTPGVVDTTIPSVSLDADSTEIVPLTVDAMTKMAAVWTAFSHEPPAVRDTAAANVKFQEKLIPLFYTKLTRPKAYLYDVEKVVNLAAMAAQYPSVAADLRQAGLTPSQWTVLRNTIVVADFVSQYRKMHPPATLPPLLGKDMDSLTVYREKFQSVIAHVKGTPPIASQRIVLELPMQVVETTSTNSAYQTFLPEYETFLPVTIHGKAVRLWIDDGGDYGNGPKGIALEPAEMVPVGLNFLDSVTRLDSLSIGADVHRDVPLSINSSNYDHIASRKKVWNKWPKGAPIVGRINMYYLMTQYDVVVDYARHRVVLYAFPPHPAGAPGWGFVQPEAAWLPSGFEKTNCSPILRRGGGDMWLAFGLQAGGQPAIAGVEWSLGGGNPRISSGLVSAMGIPANSSRLIPIPKNPKIPGGYFVHGAPVTQRLDSVALRIGKVTLWTGASEIYSTFDFGVNFPQEQSLVLVNLSAGSVHRTWLKRALFLSTSSRQVCVNGA